MADARAAPSRNRRFGEKRVGRKLLVFVGDCSQAGEVLANKPSTPLWVVIGFFDVMLRSYGQVMFCNNPVTGLLVIIALLISSPFSSLVGIVTATVSILTAWMIDQPADAIRAGIFSYNALVLGYLTSILLPQMTAIDWIFAVIGSIFSVYFTSAFGTLFGSISKHPLPALTVPFVLAQILVYLCAVSPGAMYFKDPLKFTDNDPVHPITGIEKLGFPEINDPVNGNAAWNSTPSSSDAVAATAASPPITVWSVWSEQTFSTVSTVSATDAQETNATLNTDTNTTIDMLDWGMVFTGALKAMGQVFAQEHLAASLLMYVGVIISSPTTALMCLFGSVITTLVAAVLRPSPVAPLYSGAWGFNGLLTASALGGYTLVLTPHSAALAFVGTLLTGVVHCVLLPSFLAHGVPMLSLPFNLVSLLLLCTTARGSSSLPRPPAITYPEKHRRDWVSARTGRPAVPRNRSSDSQDDDGDKKEKFRKLEMV